MQLVLRTDCQNHGAAAGRRTDCCRECRSDRVRDGSASHIVVGHDRRHIVHPRSSTTLQWTAGSAGSVALILLGFLLVVVRHVGTAEGFVGIIVAREGASARIVARRGASAKTTSVTFRPSLRKEHVDDESFGEDLDTGSVVLEDLNWRVEKLRLEEQNTQRFLKSRPRFLPYEECRKWVQAFGRWKTKQDWNEWISMGEKRNSYIPSRPDEYYGRLGQWISWDHFLLGDTCDDNDDEA